MPSVSVSIYANGNIGESKFQIFAYTSGEVLFQKFPDNVTTGTYKMALLPPGVYVFQLKNVTNLPKNYTISNQNQTLSVDWLESPVVVFNVTEVSR